MSFVKRLTAVTLTVLLTFFVLTGCSDKGELTSGGNDKDFPVTIQGVTIQDEPAGVVVLSQNLADVILAMSYEISLKGKSAECTQEDLSVLPNMTVQDVQQIKDAGADLVLLDSDPGEAEKQSLNQAGIDVLVIPAAANREDFERLYEEVGAAIKGGQTGYTHGKETAQDIFYTVDDIERVIPDSDITITMCYLYDTEGNAVTGDQFAGKLIESAGLTNAFSGSDSGVVDIESLKIANPQYIFCDIGVKQELSQKEGYQDLDAVKNGMVYELDASYLDRQGRGMIQAILFMAAQIYPELMESSDPVSSMEAPENFLDSSTPQDDPSVSSSGSSSQTTTSSGSTTTSLSGNTLKKGDQGDDVLALQKRLDELGYMFLPCTGEFGDGTEQAIKDFQYLNGMTVTGIADSETQAKLASSDAIPRE